MTTRAEARNAIAERLFNSGIFNTLNIAVPGRDFTVPPISDAPWCRIAFSDGTSEQRTIGGDEQLVRFERTARFTVQVFTEQGRGSNEGLALAESVADLYEKQRGDKPVSYESPDVSDRGVDPNGWYQHAVVVIYDFSVCK